jgi:hypothetical protein
MLARQAARQLPLPGVVSVWVSGFMPLKEESPVPKPQGIRPEMLSPGVSQTVPLPPQPMQE